MNIEQTSEKIIVSCLIVLTTFAITGALIYTKSILIPFVFSLFIYQTIKPLIYFMQKHLKLPRYISASVSFVLIFIFLALLILLTANSIENFVRDIDRYRAQLLSLTTQLTSVFDFFGMSVNTESFEKLVKSLPILNYAKKLSTDFFNFLGQSTLVFVYILFLLMGEVQISKSSKLIEEIQFNISKYVSIKIVTSTITGLITFFALLVAQVEMAFLFAILTFSFNFIPNIGSIIATLLPLPVIYLQFGFGWEFYFVLIFCTSAQFLIGNIVEPKMMGDSMDLHPITVLIFLIFWGAVWGIPGMFLAVPITSIMKIIFSRIEATKPLSEILSGRL